MNMRPRSQRSQEEIQEQKQLALAKRQQRLFGQKR